MAIFYRLKLVIDVYIQFSPPVQHTFLKINIVLSVTVTKELQYELKKQLFWYILESSSFNAYWKAIIAIFIEMNNK